MVAALGVALQTRTRPIKILADMSFFSAAIDFILLDPLHTHWPLQVASIGLNANTPMHRHHALCLVEVHHAAAHAAL